MNQLRNLQVTNLEFGLYMLFVYMIGNTYMYITFNKLVNQYNAFIIQYFSFGIKLNFVF